MKLAQFSAFRSRSKLCVLVPIAIPVDPHWFNRLRAARQGNPGQQAFHSKWDLFRVTELRQAIEICIFEHLEERLITAPTNSHWELLQQLYPAAEQPVVISANYDLLIDAAIMFVSEGRFPEGRLPNYRCGISTEFYRNEPEHFGAILKLHGSLNWLYCRTCHRLEIGASESRKYLKVLSRLVGPSLQKFCTPDGAKCPTCAANLRPLLIAPTHSKNYRNPHIIQVWYESERVLRGANRVIFIGYSLPDDDIEVIYLLKRGLAQLSAAQITVIEYDEFRKGLSENAVGRRYRTVFGDGIDWHPEGLDAWLRPAVNQP